MANVLIVNRDRTEVAGLLDTLRRSGHEARYVESARAALDLLERELIDAVLAECDATDGATTLIAQIATRWPELPVVMLTDTALAERALQQLRDGAADFIAKPFDAEDVTFVVGKALARAPKTLERPQRAEAKTATLLGDSPAMIKLRDMIQRAAAGNTTTLVRGETGTGKELVARALHEGSARRSRPFVKIDCAALPDTLLESELFGYEKGAFTGATTRKPGRVELADGGTLFLDEIGEVSAIIQAKLLRLLQERSFERLGAQKTQRVDVRFVLATHRDLETMVQNGVFRQDLFHRLNVVPIWIPPLRARRDDIELLARHFVDRFATDSGKAGIELTPAAVRLLRSQRWPGNVRQLENFMERLVVLSEGRSIDAEDVERELVQRPEFFTQRTESAPSETLPATDGTLPPLVEAVRRAERQALVTALKRAEGNRTVAARVLGVSRATLYNKLKELGLEGR
jgi:two-component system response regulator AtoC